MKSAVRLGALAFLIPFLLLAENGPRFRWCGGQEFSCEINLPIQWFSTVNVAWWAMVPGRGYWSPVVWGDRLVLTSTTNENRSCRVICLETFGGEIDWSREVLRQEQAFQKLSSVVGGFEWETVYSF